MAAARRTRAVATRWLHERLGEDALDVLLDRVAPHALAWGRAARAKGHLPGEYTAVVVHPAHRQATDELSRIVPFGDRTYLDPSTRLGYAFVAETAEVAKMLPADLARDLRKTAREAPERELPVVVFGPIGAKGTLAGAVSAIEDESFEPRGRVLHNPVDYGGPRNRVPIEVLNAIAYWYGRPTAMSFDLAAGTPAARSVLGQMSEERRKVLASDPELDSRRRDAISSALYAHDYVADGRKSRWIFTQSVDFARAAMAGIRGYKVARSNPVDYGGPRNRVPIEVLNAIAYWFGRGVAVAFDLTAGTKNVRDVFSWMERKRESVWDDAERDEDLRRADRAADSMAEAIVAAREANLALATPEPERERIVRQARRWASVAMRGTSDYGISRENPSRGRPWAAGTAGHRHTGKSFCCAACARKPSRMRPNPSHAHGACCASCARGGVCASKR